MLESLRTGIAQIVVVAVGVAFVVVAFAASDKSLLVRLVIIPVTRLSVLWGFVVPNVCSLFVF